MFNKLITGAALFLVLSPATAQKKDSLGLPGDNFDLYGAMELFKKSENPEAFEKALNSKDNEINNLDLDGDGKVDYIKVVDKTENNIHSVVMQVAVSKEELQDVAVIEIEKTGDKTAHVQIVGDEELYGKDYIIEPANETGAKANKGKEALATDNNQDDVYARSDEQTADDATASRDNNNSSSGSGGGTTVINVWGWPSVQYMYGPSYVVWASPWYYGYYPGWYDPWYPVYWRVYNRRVWHYHYPYYRRAYYYRSPAAHNYYYGRRTTANTVREHNRSGYYHQRQQAYKANVQPGKRYNAAPANPRSNRPRQSAPNNQPRSTERQGQKSSGSAPRSNQSTSPRSRSNSNNSNVERKQSSPRQSTNREATQRQQQPRQQQQQQPRTNSQPKQVSPQQPASGSRGGGNSSPRGGGGGGGGGRTGR